MVVQKYTNNLYSSEVYRELERQAVRKGHFDPTPEEIVAAAAEKVSQHQKINKVIDTTPSGDLIHDITRLAYAIRRKGFVSLAEDLEQKLMAYKVAETEYYNLKTDNPDFSIREKESDVEIAPAKDDLGKVETIFSSQKKTHDVATKNPTGKLAKASSPFYGVTQEKNIDFINFAHRDGDVNIVGAGDLGTFETIQSAAEKILAVTLKQPTGRLPKNASLSEIAKIVLAQDAEPVLPIYDLDVVKKYLTSIAGLLNSAARPDLNFSKALSQDGTGTYLHGDGHGAALFNMLTDNKANSVVNYGALVKSLFGGNPPADPTSIQNSIYENIKTNRISYLNGIPKTAQHYLDPNVYTKPTYQGTQGSDEEWEQKAREQAPGLTQRFLNTQRAAFNAFAEAGRQLTTLQSEAKKTADSIIALTNTEIKTPEDALAFAKRVQNETADLPNKAMWPVRILQGFGGESEAKQLSSSVAQLPNVVGGLVEQAQKSTNLMNDLDENRVRATLGRLASIKAQLEDAKKNYGIDADETLKSVDDMLRVIKQRAGAGSVKYLLDGLKDIGEYQVYDDLDRDTIGLLEDVKRDIARAAERK